jgi:UDP-N-acetylmuramyl pentapeptide phosphotransferase/UDP-N-acetylglucosamine-1-phosphate transferase
VVTAVAIPILIRISKRYGIYDHPDEDRKIHTRKVSYLGGVGIVLGFFIAFGTLSAEQIQPPPYVHVLWLIILGTFLLGLADDFFSLKPATRFLLQVFGAGLLVYKSGLVLPVDQVLPFLVDVPLANIILTVVVFSAITNAVNLIDGMDGLAGSLALIAGIGYSVIGFLGSDFYFMAMAMAFSGSLLGFLVYNKPKARIFMGDSGSYFLGIILSILTINFISNNSLPNIDVNDRFQIGLALIAIPSLDMTRLFFFRIINGNSPFLPDNNHIHHLLLTGGNSVGRSLAAIILLQLFLIGSALVTLTSTHFLVFAVTSTALYVFVIMFLKKMAIAYLEKQIEGTGD